MEEDEASGQERAGVTMNDDEDETRVERKSAFMGCKGRFGSVRVISMGE